MSDRISCPYCAGTGREAVGRNCPMCARGTIPNRRKLGSEKRAQDRRAHAPLSPIALDQEVGLDFDAARKSALVGPHGEEDERITEHHLNTQLRAIAARVAQEEREKARREAFVEMRHFCAANGLPFPVKFVHETRGTP